MEKEDQEWTKGAKRPIPIRDDRWERVYAAQPNIHVSPLWRTEDKVRFIADFGWQEIDPDSAVGAPLAGYRPFERGNTLQFSRRYAQVGDHVVGLNGYLFAPNGEVWKFPLRSHGWWSISPVSDGFVAHDQNDGLILFQRRPAPY